MENNIFKEAKFGDKFLTRDGRMAIILDKTYDQIRQVYNGFIVATNARGVYSSYPIDNSGLTQCWSHQRPEDLTDGSDLISHWKEPIDEDKLDELAKESKQFAISLASDVNLIPSFTSYENGFKAGYRKAFNL